MYQNGDCFTYSDNKQITTRMNTSCFSELNSMIVANRVDSAAIILKKNCLKFFSEEDRNFYLKEIQKIGVLPLSTDILEGELYIRFDMDRIRRKKSYCVFSGMLIRCLYDNDNDKFTEIARHFINMCRFFKKTDRGFLFTVACNIFLANSSHARYYNSNHILMYKSGCKILSTDTIISILDSSDSINSNFSIGDNGGFDIKLFTLKEQSKTSYKKILTDSGITPT